MNHRPVHLHSMLVHAVVALAPLAAVAFVLEATSCTAAEAGVNVQFLRGSLLGMLLISVPSLLTGIGERNHMYVNWPPSHRVKLVLSVLLLAVVLLELAAVLASDGPLRLGSWLAAAIVVGNCVAVLGLAVYGLRITLGRVSLAATSYQPDMDFDPPMDIVDCVAEFAADPAKLVEVREENR